MVLKIAFLVWPTIQNAKIILLASYKIKKAYIHILESTICHFCLKKIDKF